MRFEKHKIYIVIIGIITSLIGLAFIQVHWLDKAIATNKQIFIQSLNTSTLDVGNAYRSTEGLAETIHDLILNDDNLNEIDGLISPLIDSVLKSRSLSLNYKYGIYRHKNSKQNQLIFGTTDLEVLESSEYKNVEGETLGWTSLTCNVGGYEEGNAYDLAIFPSFISFMINQEKYSLLAFVIFLTFILSGFYFLLNIINKQKKISEIKNDFINNLTHEFKTPIFSMSLASKSLRKSLKVGNGDKLGSYIDVIDNESTRLKLQVDKILQLSLLDSEIFQLHKEQLDVHKQLEDVVENLKMIVNDKNGRVEFNFKAKHHIVLADDIHLKNTWYNIIDNAIKYSNEKPIVVIETKNKNDILYVSITDNGIGMSLEKQKMIFDRFYRISTGNIHNTKGFGIGLSYVKSIIDFHNGKIEVKSKLDFGSTFKIELPLK